MIFSPTKIVNEVRRLIVGGGRWLLRKKTPCCSRRSAPRRRGGRRHSCWPAAAAGRRGPWGRTGKEYARSSMTAAVRLHRVVDADEQFGVD